MPVADSILAGADSFVNGPAQSPKECFQIDFLIKELEPEFNSVDASLWFIIAIHDFLKAADANKFQSFKHHKNLVFKKHVMQFSMDIAKAHDMEFTWMKII